MDAKSAIEAAFRELVLQMPYAKITVTEICRNANLSRKTFYDNFQDKEGVLQAIFEDDVVKPILTMNTLLTSKQSRDMMGVYMQNIYVPIYEDKEFYRRLVRPMKGVDDTFIRVVTNSLVELNMAIMKGAAISSDLEREYVAYYFASSQAMFIQKWIFDGMPFTPQELGSLYEKMTGFYWRDNSKNLL